MAISGDNHNCQLFAIVYEIKRFSRVIFGEIRDIISLSNQLSRLTMQIQADTKYVLAGGKVVTFKKNNLPHYCWSADVHKKHYLSSEVWTDEGKAYHDDCGYNVTEQYVPLDTDAKLVNP